VIVFNSKKIEELEKKVNQLNLRIKRFEDEATIKLRTEMLEEYKRYGGLINYRLWDGGFTYDDSNGFFTSYSMVPTFWSIDLFKTILDGQKLKWLKEHKNETDYVINQAKRPDLWGKENNK